jgi:hypothetical protein
MMGDMAAFVWIVPCIAALAVALKAHTQHEFEMHAE